MKSLDQLILRKLNPEDPAFSPDPKAFQAYQPLVRNMVVSLKDSIFKKVFEFTKEDEIACFIRNYERQLIYLSNCIEGYRDKLNDAENTGYSNYFRLLDQVSEDIACLLDFLNSYFHTHFDLDKEVPKTIKEKAKKQFALKIMKISQLGDFNQDKLLKTVLLPAFDFQIDDPENVATFRKIMYLDTLLNEIIEVLKTEDEVEEALKWKLFQLNFNSMLFFCYMQKEMKEVTRQKEEDSARICILNWYLKQINQVVENPGFALNPKWRPIKESISVWIREEINYIEKYPSINDGKSLKEQYPYAKLKVEPSVPQLGILIAILVQTGFVPEKERKKLVNAFTLVFRTDQVASISEKSLLNKSRELEISTRSWALDILSQATDFVKECPDFI